MPPTNETCPVKQPGRIRCPCCRASVRGDVWYDCRCFLGDGKKTCANCQLPKAQQDENIAATMREWGWDKAPSPGMRDYLTPGWRESVTPRKDMPSDLLRESGKVSPAVHVDDFIANPMSDSYAAWMLDHFRRSALQRARFDEFMRDRRLFCTFEGKRYRVTGASRLGDVWLHSNFKEGTTYELRVDVSKCTAWGANP